MFESRRQRSKSSLGRAAWVGVLGTTHYKPEDRLGGCHPKPWRSRGEGPYDNGRGECCRSDRRRGLRHGRSRLLHREPWPT